MSNALKKFPSMPSNIPESSSDSQSRSEKRISMKYLVKALIKYNASDLHLKVGRPPLFRINGKLIPAKMDSFDLDQLRSVVYEVLSPQQVAVLESKLQIDLSFNVANVGRFRANVFFQKGTLSAVIRMIPFTIPRLDDLSVPAVIKDFCFRPRGLVLVTGATGCGKSTTLAAMVRYINENRHVHVLSIEDPIEFVHHDLKSTITQREVGSDTHSFEDALYSGLRQDPDVIVVGELREPRLIQMALTAAETGHLVISTLHTNDAKSTIERILDVFSSEAKAQVRIQLASSLVAVVSQNLLLKADGSGRVPACEVLVRSPTIENFIMKKELEKIPAAMANSNKYYHMQTLNQDLERLVGLGHVTAEEALKTSNNPEDLRLRLSGIKREEGFEIQSKETRDPTNSGFGSRGGIEK